jgi:membrane protease YdiL (CAAX protease family)
MNKTIRNLILFTVATLGAGFLGVALDKAVPSRDTQGTLGMLLWLATPLATALLLRAFGGDGWQDFGLKFNLRSGWRLYLAALLIVPLVVLLTLGLGAVFGALSLSGFKTQGFGAFLSLVGIAFVAAMVKNIFEEFAWRGYLTPRFEALKLNAFVGYLGITRISARGISRSVRSASKASARVSVRCGPVALATKCTCAPGIRLNTSYGPIASSAVNPS